MNEATEKDAIKELEASNTAIEKEIKIAENERKNIKRANLKLWLLATVGALVIGLAINLAASALREAGFDIQSVQVDSYAVYLWGIWRKGINALAAWALIGICLKYYFNVFMAKD